MKKIIVLLLALMMVFALVACDQGDTPGNTDNPGTSQGGEENPGGNTNNSGGEENNTKTYAWPSSVDEIKWTGAGKIVGINELAGSSKGEVWIYIDTATLDEVGAYIEMLKGRGIKYHGEGEEPALAFEYGEYCWAGASNSLRITLLEEPDTTAAADGKYQLKIVVYTEVDY